MRKLFWIGRIVAMILFVGPFGLAIAMDNPFPIIMTPLALGWMVVWGCVENDYIRTHPE